MILKFKHLIIILTSLWVLSCGQNHHITQNQQDNSTSGPLIVADNGGNVPLGGTGFFDVLKNDSSIGAPIDSNSLTITDSSSGACLIWNGIIQFNPIGAIGPRVCKYKVCDTNGDCGSTTVTFSVSAGCTITSGTKQVFSYTGADQNYTPTDTTITHFYAKAWGAGGGGNSALAGALSGGAGGFSEIVVPAIASNAYLVIVGEGGEYIRASATPPTYGGGGSSPIPTPESLGAGPNDGDGSGGGLSGVFQSAFVQLDALVIAGGGGGAANADYTTSTTPSGAGGHCRGGNGNNPSSGGEAGMLGSNGVQGSYTQDGGGGGGYNGGSSQNRYDDGSGGFSNFAGEGGSGFLHTSKVAGQVLYTIEPSVVAPQSADGDYLAGVSRGGTANLSTSGSAGNGLVVIYELCGNNNNNPFASIDRTTTPLNTPITKDVITNDGDIDNDLDSSSMTISLQAPALEGNCVLGPQDGEITFTPESGFVGTTSCEYQICDSSGSRCDTANLEVVVGL